MPLLGSRPHILNQLVKKERKRPSTAQTSTAPPPDSPPKSSQQQQQQHQFVVDVTQEICSSAGELNRKNRIYSESIWTCRCTGRTNLKYKEAVKSEKSCQRLLKKLFPKYYVPAALEIVHHSTETIENVVNRVHRKLHQEFFLNEPVCLKNKVRDKIIKGTIYRKDEPANALPTSPSAASSSSAPVSAESSASNASTSAAAAASSNSSSQQNGACNSAASSPAKEQDGTPAAAASADRASPTADNKKSESPGQDKENKNKSPPQKIALLPYTYAIQLDEEDQQVISRVPASAIARETRLPSKENIRLFIRASALRYGSNNSGPWIVDEDLVKKYRLKAKIADLVLDKHQVMLNSVESEIDALRKLDGLPVSRKSGGGGSSAVAAANGDASVGSSKKRKDGGPSPGAGGKKMKQMTLFDMKGKSPFKVVPGGASASASKTPGSRALQQLPPIGLKLVRAVKMERSEQMIKVLLNKCAQVLTERQVNALPAAVRERLRAVQARLNEKRRIEAMTPEQREEYRKAKREEAKLKAKMTLDAKKRRFEDSHLLTPEAKSLPAAKPIELPVDFPPTQLGRTVMLAEFFCAYRPLLGPSAASSAAAAGGAPDEAGVVTIGDDNMPLSIDNLIDALVSKEPSGYAYLGRLLTMLLRTLLQDEDIAGGRRELGTLLTDMPVSEYTAGEMARVLLAPRKRGEEVPAEKPTNGNAAPSASQSNKRKDRKRRRVGNEDDASDDNNSNNNADEDEEEGYEDEENDNSEDEDEDETLTPELASLLERMERFELHELSVEDKLSVLEQLAEKLLKSDVLADYIEDCGRRATAAHKKRVAALKAKNDKLKSEKAKRKSEKAASAAGSSAAGADESAKQPVAASVKMSSRLIALAEQAREREVREKAERQRRAEEAEWARIDAGIAAAEREYERAMSDSRAATRARPLGRDRSHARYWHLRCAPGRLLVETGWAGVRDETGNVGADVGSVGVASAAKSPAKSTVAADIKAASASSTAQDDEAEELTWPTDDSAPNEWRQLDTEADLDELLASLFPTGVRESALQREIDRLAPRLRREIKHRQSQLPASATDAKANSDSQSAVVNLKSMFAEELARTEAGLTQGGLGGVPNPAKLKKTLDQCDSASIAQLANCMLMVEKHVLERFRYGAFKDAELTEQWRASVASCGTLGRLNFLLSVLDSSVNWDKSTANAKCQVCRIRRDPPNLLLCDKCNRAFHPDCLRPRLTERPTGDWFCLACAPSGARRPGSKNNGASSAAAASADKKSSRRRQRRSRGFYDEDEDEEEDEDVEEEDQPVCQVCEHSAESAGASLIQCQQCRSSYHPGCHEPPIRANSRSAFRCVLCRRPGKSEKQTASGGGKAAVDRKSANGRRSSQSRKKAATSEHEDEDEEEDEEEEGRDQHSDEEDDDEEDQDVNHDEDDDEEEDEEADHDGMEVDNESNEEDADEEEEDEYEPEESKPSKRVSANASTASKKQQQQLKKVPAKRGRKSASSVASLDSSVKQQSKKQQPSSSSSGKPADKRRLSLQPQSKKRSSGRKPTVEEVSDAEVEEEDDEEEEEIVDAGKKRSSGKRARYSSGGGGGGAPNPPPGKRAKLHSAAEEATQQQRLCKVLLDKICRHRDAWPFVDPVDPEDAPDYHQIVKQPICLTDMRNRLQRGGYDSVAQLMSDFALLFGNATEYNPAESKELSCALRLEEQLAKLLNQHGLIERYPRRSFYI